MRKTHVSEAASAAAHSRQSDIHTCELRTVPGKLIRLSTSSGGSAMPGSGGEGAAGTQGDCLPYVSNMRLSASQVLICRRNRGMAYAGD